MLTSTKSLPIKYSLFALLILTLSSCFTGIESTPRIGSNEVRRNQAAKATAEQLFLADIKPLPPSQWVPGQTERLIVDARFARILAPASQVPDNLVGRTIIFSNWETAASLTGDDASDIVFIDPADSTRFAYRVAIPVAALDTVSNLDVPFTIDLQVVAETNQRLRGRTLYAATPNWYDNTGRDIAGLRHVELKVDSVVPGTYLYPAAIHFTLTDSIQARNSGIDPVKSCMLYMSVGGIGASTRTFDRLFTLENPRQRFREIEDDVWELIIHSRVRIGMSRDECRLALGSPSAINRYPTRGGMREIWNYSDGVYLAFDDGYLSDFRQ